MQPVKDDASKNSFRTMFLQQKYRKLLRTFLDYFKILKKEK